MKRKLAKQTYKN